MDIIETISNISNHKYQKINSNQYEQGNPYIKSCMEVKNNYIKIPNISSNNMDTLLPKNICNIVQFRTVFDKIIFHFDNILTIDNLFDYKNRFFDTISDDIYKSVSKRHNMLKKSMFSFVHESEYKIPDNKDVMLLLSSIINYNIIVIHENVYIKYCTKSDNRTITIDKHTNGKVYDDIASAEMELVHMNKYELLDFNSMKLSELKEYVQKNKIEVDSGIKKKEALIKYLSTQIKN